uniref:Uncharacterized protein n=1 Tax=Romanomermis culicivorax TaxID=13658 RepID=A0A915IF83_ROMCU
MLAELHNVPKTQIATTNGVCKVHPQDLCFIQSTASKPGQCRPAPVGVVAPNGQNWDGSGATHETLQQKSSIAARSRVKGRDNIKYDFFDLYKTDLIDFVDDLSDDDNNNEQLNCDLKFAHIYQIKKRIFFLILTFHRNIRRNGALEIFAQTVVDKRKFAAAKDEQTEKYPSFVNKVVKNVTFYRFEP